MKPKVTQSLSVRAIQSTRSVRSFNDDDSDREIVLDFDQMMTTACSNYAVSRKTIVKKDIRIDEYMSMKPSGPFQLRRNARRAQNLNPQQHPSPTEKSVESDTKSTTDLDVGTIVITAIYNIMNNLEEILLQKQSYVPRKVIQIIGLIAPLYRELKKMTLKRCNLNAYTIYEMSKFLPLTSITEICLDDSCCKQSNYALLLTKPCRLVSLSLCRCNINDNTCLEIASKLHYTEPAELTLSALNLSSNHLTDVAANSIGEALRTNRHLRYLNLAGNRITDDGVDRILAALTDFTLNHDEIMNKRRRYIEYLKMKQAVYLKCYLDSKSVDQVSIISKRSQARKISKPKKDSVRSATDSEDVIRMRAEALIRDMVGPFRDPFNSFSTKSVDGEVHCLGNMILSYLNVSYNNLTYFGVKKIQAALLYQSSYKKLGDVGLLRVCIDGNSLPNSCLEFQSIESLLTKNINSFTSRFNADGRKKVKSSRMSIPEKY